MQRRAKILHHLFRQRRHGQARTQGVGEKREIAARGAHGRDPAAVQRAENVQHLQRFHERFQRIDSSHAEALEQSTHQNVGTGERRRMRYDHFLGDLGATDLHGNDGLAQLSGDVDRLLEGLGVGHRFHKEPQRRDPILSGEGVDRIMEIELQPVPQGYHVGDGQAAPLHGEVETHVRRHGDDGHAFVDPSAALLVGPEHRPVEIVEEPVAIRSDQGHVTRGFQELPLQLSALLACLDKACGIADRAARIPRSEISDDVDGEVAIDTHVRSIGASR